MATILGRLDRNPSPAPALPPAPPPSWPAMLFAASFTLVVNAGLLALVAVLTHVHGQAEPQVEVAARFSVQPPPPPPPAEPEREQTQPQAEPEALLPQLPPLLPAEPTPGALALPPPGVGDTSLDNLPLAMPGLALALPTAGAATGPAAPMRIDHAAHIDSPPDVARFYPNAARGHGITGESVVALRIEADGSISSFTIDRSTPEGVFEDALGGLVRNLHAEPATAQGHAVPSTLRVRIQWTLPK